MLFPLKDSEHKPKPTINAELTVGEFDSVTSKHDEQLYVSTSKTTFMAATQSPGTSPAKPNTSLADRLSKNLAARRRVLGLTQAQVAERLGVDTETLSRFERGRHLPSLANLERLAKVLTTTIAELLDEGEMMADDEALVVNAWLSALQPADRAFAKDLLKQCCDYLSNRRTLAKTTGRDAPPD